MYVLYGLLMVLVRWNLPSLRPFLAISSVWLSKKVCDTVMIVSSLLTVCPGDSINQGDLTVEIVH